MITTILLDIDGTLVDSNDAHAKAWQEALDEEGFDTPYSLIRPLIGMGGDNLLPALLGISAEDELGKQIQERRAQIFKEDYLPELKAFPQTRELLELFLSWKLKLVVATSASEKDLSGILKQVHLDDLLKIHVNADDAENSKPDPDIIIAALKKAKVSASEALMIGDTPYDISASLKAGVPIIGVLCGGWDRHQLKGAIETYDNPAQILSHIDSSMVIRSFKNYKGLPSSG